MEPLSSRREFLAQLGQCIDGVGRPRTTDFPIVDHERGLSGHGSLHHGDAQCGIRQRAFAMRRVAGGQEAHLGEPQRLPQFEGGAQVAVVDRI